MRSLLRFLPLGIISASLTLVILAAGALRHPGLPALFHQGYQSFVGVMVLLMQL